MNTEFHREDYDRKNLLADVRLDPEGLLGKYSKTAAERILPVEYEKLVETGRMAGIEGTWKPGDGTSPHIFWDSDIAKWIEAAAYEIQSGNDKDGKLEALLDGVADKYEKLQLEDGYVNSHFCVDETEKRFSNTRDCHELYTIGHMTEAAVAYFNATGKRKFLDVMIRAVNNAADVFGPEEGKKKGYPGHEEIELALYKLYKVTNDEKYINLLKYFVYERGKQPHYWNSEAEDRKDGRGIPSDKKGLPYSYYQAHKPILEQDTVEGHAVRAMYLYAGAADLAKITGDIGLMTTLEKLWENCVRKRMYITGGVGSSTYGERFTYDYDLPNETAYSETCASIGLVMWSQRMLDSHKERKYADIIETALYNCILGSVSDDGTKFLYANPLAINMTARKEDTAAGSYPFAPGRQEWFGCACCPPNIARIFADLPNYIFGVYGDGRIYVHQYTSGTLRTENGEITIKTDYPWDGKIIAEVKGKASLAFRIPGWSRAQEPGALHLKFDGEPVKDRRARGIGDNFRFEKGYMYVDDWEGTLSFRFPMPAETVYANPHVLGNYGKVAIMRGPLVYCFEQFDNKAYVHNIEVGFNPDFTLEDAPSLGKNVKVIRFNALVPDETIWRNRLYSYENGGMMGTKATAIPYFLRLNRGECDMTVWIKE